jgi:hypothetical protein
MKILPIICFIAIIGCATSKTENPPDNGGRRLIIHTPAFEPEDPKPPIPDHKPLAKEEETEDDMIIAFALDIYRAQRFNAMRAIGGVALVVLLLHWSRRLLDKVAKGFGFTIIVILVTTLLIGLLTWFT